MGRLSEPHRRPTDGADAELACVKQRTLEAVASAVRGPLSARRAFVAPQRQRGGAVPPKPLPSSIERGAAFRVPPVQEPASSSFQWTPFFVRQNEPAVCAAMAATLETHGTGTYVNTLTMELRKETFEGAAAHVLRLDPERFVPKGGKPWCYKLRGSIPCVVMKGIVLCRALSREEGREGPLQVARLPEDMRPTRPLRFAALSRELAEGGRTSSRLVTLLLLPDGNLFAESGPAGRDEVQRGAVIDLSAVRFCTGNGISLIDDALLYLCDVNGTRIICLQGQVGERFFKVAGRKRLALLPSSCTPPEELAFVAPGTSGGYHLLMAKPHSERGLTGSGELLWRDSIWARDSICLNGLMWEAAPVALLHDNPMLVSQATESQIISIMDFQKYLNRRFGTIEEAWTQAFDTDGSGSVNFTEFGLGCKKAGFVGNATKLWAALDIDRSGEISLEELSLDTTAMLRNVHAEKVRQLDEAREKEAKDLELASTAAPSRNFSSAGGSNSRPSTRGSAMERTQSRRGGSPCSRTRSAAMNRGASASPSFDSRGLPRVAHVRTEPVRRPQSSLI